MLYKPPISPCLLLIVVFWDFSVEDSYRCHIILDGYQRKALFSLAASKTCLVKLLIKATTRVQLKPLSRYFFLKKLVLFTRQMRTQKLWPRYCHEFEDVVSWASSTAGIKPNLVRFWMRVHSSNQSREGNFWNDHSGNVYVSAEGKKPRPKQ